MAKLVLQYATQRDYEDRIEHLEDSLRKKSMELRSVKRGKEESDAKIIAQQKTINQMSRDKVSQNAIIEAQKETIRTYQKKYDDVVKQLRKHDNPNTPSSQKNFTGKRAGKDKRGKRSTGTGKRKRNTNRGKKIQTRPTPDRTETRKLDDCPKCGSDDLEMLAMKFRLLVDDHMKEKPPTETIAYFIQQYMCRKCNCKVANDADLPKKGEFSTSIILNVARGFRNRVPFRLIVSTLAAAGVKMSAKTALNIMVTIGWMLEIESNQILERIRESKVLHADETSYKFNGVKYWVWVFLNPHTGERYYKITPGRNKQVVKDVLGEDWNGTIICDGWNAYKQIKKLQRCWAHLIRVPEHASDKDVDGAEHIRRMLSRIHKDGKIYARNKSRAWREAQVPKLEARVRLVIENCRKIPELKKFAGTLERAMPNLFVYVVDNTVDSTNNAAERALREIVVQRKVRGGARSEKTRIWMANFFTCVLSWEAQGKSVDEILKYV